MQGFAIFRPVMRAPRGLAIDGDHVRIAVAQARDPIHETRLEQLGIDPVQHVGQRIVARDAVAVWQIGAQEIETFKPPFTHLDQIVRPSDRGAHEQQNDFFQRIHNLDLLTRVFQGCKVLQNRQFLTLHSQDFSSGHGRLHPIRMEPHESHRLTPWESNSQATRHFSSDHPGRYPLGN